MNSNDHLLKIIEILAKKKIKFIVCGGVAVVLHGIERATMDLDLALKMYRQNIQNFIHIMNTLGLTPRVPVPAEYLLNPKNIQTMIEEKNAIVFTFIDPKNPFIQIDLFLKNDLSYDYLIKESETIRIGAYKIKVASKKLLIKMKEKILPTREKDALDILMLKKRMKEE